MRKILPILLALAMVLTLLPVSAFAVGTDRTEDLAALEEQMRQELFSADDRIYAEDYGRCRCGLSRSHQAGCLGFGA